MRKIYSFAITILFLFSSCNDWLDVKPQSEISEKDMFETEQGFKDALTSCYIKMNDVNLYGRALTMREIEYLAQHWSYAGVSSTVQSWKDFDYTDSNVDNMIATIYGALYNVIVQANIILVNLPEKGGNITTERMRNIIEAEALAVRAFCHMDVLRLFGQVPGGERRVSLPYAETVSTVQIPYYDVEGFAGKILTDITRAESLLKDNDPLMLTSQANPERHTGFDESDPGEEFYSYRRFRFNSYALKGMRARLYLWMGRAEDAHSEAMELITALRNPLQEMSLSGTSDAGTSDLINGRYSLPSECIMALSNFEMKNISDNLFNPDNLYQSETTLNEIFAGQPSYNNRHDYLWDRAATNGQGIRRPLLKKFLQPGSGSVPTLEKALYHEVMPLLRLSEIYLIAMETAPSLSAANSLYATYMQARAVSVSASYFSDQAELTEEIVREYRREFYGEGQMFYTYKRLNRKNMLWKNREITEDDYIIPLPLSEPRYNN